MVAEGAIVVVYSAAWCGYCRAAETLLASRGVEFRRYAVSGSPARNARNRTQPKIRANAAKST